MSYLESLFSLDNKISIVTGAAGGNGKSISEALLRSGSTVIMIDILKKELTKNVKKFQNENLPAIEYYCDITNKKQILELGKYINGGGGGQAFFSTAGGKNLNGITEAIKAAESICFK